MKKKQRNTKVALMMAGSLQDAPYDDGSYDIWILNDSFRHAERFDLLFDMHDWTKADYYPKYYEELMSKDFPIVKPAADPRLQNVAVYPQEITMGFGHLLKHSSIYMLLYAVWQEYKRIYFYGLTGGEFRRHPYMGYAFYYALGIARATTRVYLVNRMAMDNYELYGTNLRWRKSDILYEGFDEYTLGNVNEEFMSDTRKGRKQKST